jgi:hypothetical protein
MTTKHTPGPWSVVFEKTSTGKDFGIICGGSGRSGLMDTVICHAPDSQSEPTSFKRFQEANARLMAAAPELLAALNALLDDVGRANSMLGAVQARAAIAKAIGALK